MNINITHIKILRKEDLSSEGTGVDVLLGFVCLFLGKIRKSMSLILHDHEIVFKQKCRVGSDVPSLKMKKSSDILNSSLIKRQRSRHQSSGQKRNKMSCSSVWFRPTPRSNWRWFS